MSWKPGCSGCSLGSRLEHDHLVVDTNFLDKGGGPTSLAGLFRIERYRQARYAWVVILLLVEIASITFEQIETRCYGFASRGTVDANDTKHDRTNAYKTFIIDFNLPASAADVHGWSSTHRRGPEQLRLTSADELSGFHGKFQPGRLLNRAAEPCVFRGQFTYFRLKRGKEAPMNTSESACISPIWIGLDTPPRKC